MPVESTISVTVWADARLDGSPAAWHACWRAPDGTLRTHHERLDEGATWEEVGRLSEFLIAAVQEDPF